MDKPGTASDLKPQKKTGARYKKAQILEMRRYRRRADALSVLLSNSSLYSHDDVERLLKDFDGRKVD